MTDILYSRKLVSKHLASNTTMVAHGIRVRMHPLYNEVIIEPLNTNLGTARIQIIVNPDEVLELVYALQHLVAGPLGKLALEAAKALPATPGFTTVGNKDDV